MKCTNPTKFPSTSDCHDDIQSMVNPAYAYMGCAGQILSNHDKSYLDLITWLYLTTKQPPISLISAFSCPSGYGVRLTVIAY